MLKNYSILILAISFSFGCRDHNVSKESPLRLVNWPAEVTDSIFTITQGSLEIPVVLHLPDCDQSDYPVVVIMHGSGGMWKNNSTFSELSSQFRPWKEFFDNQCVGTLFIDSYSPRGAIENEGDYKYPPKTFEISAQFERPKDANAALLFLASLVNENGLKIVQSDHIGLLGFSHGATAVESTIFDSKLVPANHEWQQTHSGVSYSVPVPPVKPETVSYAAAIVYYPGSSHKGYFGPICNPEEAFYLNYCPLLMQLASDDPLTDNSLCLINTIESKGGEVDYFLYEGANHSFDNETTGTDGEAADLARTHTLEWFKKYLDF